MMNDRITLFLIAPSGKNFDKGAQLGRLTKKFIVTYNIF